MKLEIKPLSVTQTNRMKLLEANIKDIEAKKIESKNKILEIMHRGTSVDSAINYYKQEIQEILQNSKKYYEQIDDLFALKSYKEKAKNTCINKDCKQIFTQTFSNFESNGNLCPKCGVIINKRFNF